MAVCTTKASADFVTATLAAYGIQTTVSWTFHAYPSLGWVEGYSVTVVAENEAEARALLSALSRDDVLEPPPPGTRLDDDPPPPSNPPSE